MLDVGQLEKWFRDVCQDENGAEVGLNQWLRVFTVHDWYGEIDNIYTIQVSWLYQIQYIKTLHLPCGAERVPAPVVKA